MRLKNAIKSYLVFMIACLFLVTSVSGENIKTFIIINGVGYDDSYSEQGDEEYDWLLKESRKHHGNFDDVIYFAQGKWRNFKSGEILEEGFDGRYLLFNTDGKLEEVNESENNIKNLKVVSVGAQKDRIILTFNMMMRGLRIQQGKFYSVNGVALEDDDITIDYEENRIYLNVGYIGEINSLEISKEAFKDYSIEFEDLKYEIVKVNDLDSVKDDGKIYVLIHDDIELKGKVVSGKLYIGGNNIKLNGVKLDGSLFVDPGKEGNLTLSNSEISEIVVLSGGSNSIHIDKSEVENIDVQTSRMRLAIENESEINLISVQTVAQIESTNSTVEEINIQSKGYKKEEKILLKGQFNKVVSNSGISTVLEEVSIKELKLKENPKVKIKSGKVLEVEVYSDGTIYIDEEAHVIDVYTNGNKVEIQGKIQWLKDRKILESNYQGDNGNGGDNGSGEQPQFEGKWIRHNVINEKIITDISFEGVMINGKSPEAYVIKSKDGLSLTEKLSISRGFRILGILIEESFVEFYAGEEFLGKCSMKIQNDDFKGTFKKIQGEWSVTESFEGALTSQLNISILEDSWNYKMNIFSGDLLIGEISEKSGNVRSLKIILNEVDKLSIEIMDRDDKLIERVYPRIESELELIK